MDTVRVLCNFLSAYENVFFYLILFILRAEPSMTMGLISLHEATLKIKLSGIPGSEI